MHGVISWWADLLRLPVALVYWNWRKTRFRARGGRCPCQHPSDSGEAGKTGCEAGVEWNRPMRFRWVCPLLQKGEHGAMCSVNARDVRPFWGRAVLIFASGLLALHAVGAGAVLFGLRATGVDRIGWIDVAWPGRWPAIPQARARYFSQRAAALLQERDFAGAEMSLLSALHLAPGDYDTTLFLAHLRQYQQNYHQSDALFRQLIISHPDRAHETSVGWHDALLMRRRFGDLAGLSLRMAAVPSGPTQAWIRSALFAVRSAGDSAELLRHNSDQIAALSRPAGVLFRAEELRQQGASSAASDLLIGTAAGPLTPYLVTEYVEQLLRLDARDQAEVVLRRHAAGLSAFDRGCIRLRIDQAYGDPALVRLGFESLLQAPMTPATLDRLTAWLVEYPDGRSFARLDHAFRRPEARAAVSGMGIWLAAKRCGAVKEAADWAKYGRERLGIYVPTEPALSLAADGAGPDPRLLFRLITTCGLSREVIFSLLQRSLAGKKQETAAVVSP